MTRDLRSYTKQTNVRLGLGAAFLLLVIGVGLIWWVYGPGAAMMGLICMLGAALPIGLILLSLQILDWIQKRADRD